MRIFLISVAFFLLLSACSYNELSLCDNEIPSYEECIKPIFTQYCVSCHNQQQQSGGLILETYDEISTMVVAGNVIDRISRDETDPLFMPLGFPKLKKSEIQLIVNWNANGAPNN